MFYTGVSWSIEWEVELQMQLLPSIDVGGCKSPVVNHCLLIQLLCQLNNSV